MSQNIGIIEIIIGTQKQEDGSQVSGDMADQAMHQVVKVYNGGVVDIIKKIQDWYKSNCDGDWEHSYGVKIATLDNPGWHVKIALKGTKLEGKKLKEVDVDKGDDDWINCRVIENEFDGNGDSDKLEQILKIFLDYAKAKNEKGRSPR